MHLGRGENGERIFLAIDGAGGERRLRVGPAHLRRVGAERGEDLVVNGRTDHAEFHAFHVCRRPDRTLRVGDFTEAVLAPRERHHAVLFQYLEYILADFALGEGVDGGVIGHQERQRKQVQLFHLRRPVDGRADGEIDHALADGGELARLIARYQRRAGIHLYVDLAVGALAHQIGPDLAALAPWKSGPDHRRQAVLGLVLALLRGGGQGEREGGREQHQQQVLTHHFLLLWFAY